MTYILDMINAKRTDMILSVTKKAAREAAEVELKKKGRKFLFKGRDA